MRFYCKSTTRCLLLLQIYKYTISHSFLQYFLGQFAFFKRADILRCTASDLIMLMMDASARVGSFTVIGAIGV